MCAALSYVPKPLSHVGACDAQFPTSEVSLLAEGDKLALYYRGFDGAYYKSVQRVAGDVGGKFGGYNRLGGMDDPNAIFE